MRFTWRCQSCERVGSIRTDGQPFEFMAKVRRSHQIAASGCAGGMFWVMSQSAAAVNDRERVAEPKVAPPSQKE